MNTFKGEWSDPMNVQRYFGGEKIQVWIQLVHVGHFNYFCNTFRCDYVLSKTAQKIVKNYHICQENVFGCSSINRMNIKKICVDSIIDRTNIWIYLEAQ